MSVPLAVVGVVRDTNSASLYRDREISLYLPQGLADERDLHVIVFAGSDTRVMASLLRQRAHAIDAGVRFTATPLDSLLRFWILPSRVATVAAVILGVLALALATLGLYAVMAYDVAHRTREIGVRLALGAGAGDVVRLVLADGGRLLVAGIVIGIGAAVAVSRVLHQFLFGVSIIDPLTFVLVPAFLTVVAIAACYIPARRASRIAPLDALRSR
jgi:putative ABC transport system permease protein